MTTTTKLENHASLDQNYDEACGCPVHSTKVKKAYDFGKYQDATVFVFRGCRCAVSFNHASALLGPDAGLYRYHTNYSDASGRARLIVAKENLDNAPFEYHG